ncbi:uncharacterized protein DUF4244 [Glaciihabitans tibetensis]|uniref:Uncharacterized protein DUF4244 n=1 Tax=Glaciihabitans tibetensis TaxID=1266600 RepID=A0A2T0V5K3_9MICO|nr:uncharacterized protein DUF4244 [Glaciihabitans tibetensis]
MLQKSDRSSSVHDTLARIIPIRKDTLTLRRRLSPARQTSARLRLGNPEAGAATAEYVIATMAAVGFAGLLVVIMRGDEVRGMLTDLVRNALTLVS